MSMLNAPKQAPRDRLLDVAEKLFSRRGFYGVSVRQITDAASLRLASVNYYFETKLGLFQAVLMRRAMIIVDERKSRLSKIDFDHIPREDALQEIVLAIVEPIYQRVASGDPGWRAYISLVANVATMELRSTGDLTPLNALDQVSVDFVNALSQVSTAGDKRQAHHAFQFITGTTLYMLSNNGRINKLSGGKYLSDDYSTIYPDMIEYISRGTHAILAP